MARREVKKFRANTFYLIANEIRKNTTDEEEIEKRDLTEIFWKELKVMIENGEIIIININAKPRLGKSTLGIKIGKEIFEMLKKAKQQPPDAQFGINNIARDDQEYSKIMRDPDTRFTVIVTDESNELEKTGENVTVENALKRVFSDVQAGRYVHHIAISPKETIDENADIQLHLTSTDKETMTSHCKLYYRFYEGGNDYNILIGYINVQVDDILGNWERVVKKHYIKRDKNKRDEEVVEQWRRKDFYVEYMIKKYEKMELITKEGIYRPRLLDNAEIILNTINELAPLTKIKGILGKDIVRNYIRMGMREAKIPTSIVGEELATREALGTLELMRSYESMDKQIRKLEKMMGTEEGKKVLPTIKRERDTLRETARTIWRMIIAQKTEFNRLKEINEKYKIRKKKGDKSGNKSKSESGSRRRRDESTKSTTQTEEENERNGDT